MSRNVQLLPVTVSDDSGLLITSPRRYNVLTQLLFGGRHARLLRDIVHSSGVAPGDRALDIGCGPGKLVAALGEAVGSGGAATGVDPSAEMVGYARAHVRASNCRFESGVAQALPFGDGEFDVVTCTFVMHHIAAAGRDEALAQMWRVLRPGGLVLLADAHPSGVMRAVTTLMGRRMPPASDAKDAVAQTDSLSEIDVRRYADALRAVGFSAPDFTVSRYSAGILTARKPVTAAGNDAAPAGVVQ